MFPAELPSPEEPNLAAFRQALRHLGYVEGQTVALESRYALGRGERVPELIAELIQLQVDILVVGSARAAVAGEAGNTGDADCFLGAADPVETGLVASLARPGGNITGLSFAFSEGFGGKWVEFLKKAVPEASQVAFLQHPASTWRMACARHPARGPGPWRDVPALLGERARRDRRRLCHDDCAACRRTHRGQSLLSLHAPQPRH